MHSSWFACEGHLWGQQVEQEKNGSDLLERTEHEHLNFKCKCCQKLLAGMANHGGIIRLTILKSTIVC